MKVKIADLQNATNKIFDYLQEQDVDEIEISEDYYWVIDENELYDPYKEPKTFTLGQLSSDIEDIQKMASGSLPVVGFSLVPLSALFKYIGEKRAG